MADEEPQKCGSGHVGAMARQGLSELRGAFYPESNVAQPTEYGMYGRVTPGEVAESREATPDRDEEPKQGSVLEERLQQAQTRGDEGRESPEQERER
jgi:hypothetical protein